jgi:nucleotide-binding universal stress UspA family protein
MSAETAAATPVIVVGIDGSDSSIDALRWALHQADLVGAGVEAITAWQWPRTMGKVLPFAPDYDPAGDADRLVSEIVDRVAGTFPSSITARARSVQGHPAEVLVEAARHADLLVVGSRGHGTLSGVVLGSVSQYCVAHAESPVLVHRRHR